MSILKNINNSYSSYQQLISFYQKYKDSMFEDINIEFRQWFAANLSAALGIVLDSVSELNFIHFEYIKPEIKQILLRNEFLSYYGFKKLRDVNHTTIKYLKLKPTDGKFFKTYVIKELLNREELPDMSLPLKEKMVESIYEIFVNAQIHSECTFIYTCGQFFPKKNKIEFTIADNGIGFKKRINKHFNANLTSQQAISWAVQDRKTTKSVTGGIGLALLKEFISKNKGKMQIVSNDGYYHYIEGNQETREFKGEFPGTIVNLQFRTDDSSNYTLKSELEDINDIF